MRVALLPAGPDPFGFAYWFRNFRTWEAEVDRLHVLVADQDNPAARAYIDSFASKRVTILHYPKRVDHGQALGMLMDTTEAPHVLLMEDDAYVRAPGAVDARFRRLEADEVDVIGGPRGNAGEEIIAAATEAFGEIPTAASGEAGHALWPCFLFAKRDILLATDRHYGAHYFRAGDRVPGLGLRVRTETGCDTFAGTSYQLRRDGARIAIEGQFRVSNRGQADEWRPIAPWMHVGSLSTGYGNLLANDGGRVAPIDPTANGDDWARRVSWWQRFARTSEALPEQRARYGDELDAFVIRSGIDRGQVDEWTRVYDAWITWAER